MKPKKPARLQCWPATYVDGKLRTRERWMILDGETRKPAGNNQEDAERAFADYVNAKQDDPTGLSPRMKSAAQVRIVDVLSFYLKHHAPGLKRSKDIAQHAEALLRFFSETDVLASLTKLRCQEYVRWRHSQPWRRCAGKTVETAGWHDLRLLGAAINVYTGEKLLGEIVKVKLPPKPKPRERWLTRSEFARILWAAWRAKTTAGNGAVRHTGRHVARFMLFAIWTGSRSGPICRASFYKQPGRSHVETWTEINDKGEPELHGLFHRLATGAKESSTKKEPTIKLHPRLLAHLERWQRLGLCESAVIEYNGKPVQSIKKAFAAAVRAAGVDPEGIVPHTLRHTAATWMLQQGGSDWEVAGYLGMSLETLKQYAHQHPDHQEGALAALGRSAPAAQAPRSKPRRIKLTSASRVA